jgi:hypothetical protein
MRFYLMSRPHRAAVAVSGDGNDGDSAVSTGEIKALIRRVAELETRCRRLESTDILNKRIRFYASLPRTRLVFDRIVLACTDKAYSRGAFCYRELPVLLAHMVHMLDAAVPPGLASTAPVSRLRRHLCEAFQALISAPKPLTPEAVRSYATLAADTVDRLEERDVLGLMGRGVALYCRAVLDADDSWHGSHFVDAPGAATDEAVAAGNGAGNGSGAVDEEGAWHPTRHRHKRVRGYDLHADEALQVSMDAFHGTYLHFRFLCRQLHRVEMDEATGTTPAVAAAGTKSTDTHVGLVDTHLDLYAEAQSAARIAAGICEEHFGDAPDIEVSLHGPLGSPLEPRGRTEDQCMVEGVAEALQYILLELLKNALRSTVERHMRRDSVGMVRCDDMPPVRIMVSTNGPTAEHATLTVRDSGFGIPRDELTKVFSYSYSSAHRPLSPAGSAARRGGSKNDKGADAVDDDDDAGGYHHVPAAALVNPIVAEGGSEDSAVALDNSMPGGGQRSPLAGFGYGLPLSRLYAQMFGGDLRLSSMEGMGADAVIYLRKRPKLD